MRYIKQYKKTAKPVRWAYADPTRRIAWSLYKSFGQSTSADAVGSEASTARTVRVKQEPVPVLRTESACRSRAPSLTP